MEPEMAKVERSAFPRICESARGREHSGWFFNKRGLRNRSSRFNVRPTERVRVAMVRPDVCEITNERGEAV